MEKSAVASIEKSIAALASQSDHKVLAIWATDCAERALPAFEAKYADDKRPRAAIEAGRAWISGVLKMTEARKAAFASHAAARDAQETRKLARRRGRLVTRQRLPMWLLMRFTRPAMRLRLSMTRPKNGRGSTNI